MKLKEFSDFKLKQNSFNFSRVEFGVVGRLVGKFLIAYIFHSTFRIKN